MVKPRASIVLRTGPRGKGEAGAPATLGYARAMSGPESPDPVAEGGTPGLDPVVERYKRDVDRTLIRENLARSVDERLERLMELQRFAIELREAGRRAAPG